MNEIYDKGVVESWEPTERPRSRWALTCEHASENFPAPYSLPPRDAFVRGTHWAYDLGARDLTLELAATLRAPAVLARFSRLLVDPNRALDSATLFREIAEGQTLELNRRLSESDRAQRLALFYSPFHAAVRELATRPYIDTLFAIHTFTPIYEGAQRQLEIGVLYNREVELGESLRKHLNLAEFVVESNEPYSGKDGLMYVAESHADVFQKRAVELEVRQDLAVDPNFRARLIASLSAFVLNEVQAKPQST